MKTPVSHTTRPRLITLSEEIYQRLLSLYPGEHRREYGAAMAQLFHDQCCDAWRESRARGLAWLWLHTSVDLAKTTTLEHLRNLKQRTSLFGAALQALRRNPTPGRTFLALFAMVLALAFGSSVLLAYLQPELYASSTRFKVERDFTGIARANLGYDPYFLQTQMALAQSDSVLERVAKNLNLAESWGKTYSSGAPLSEAQTLDLLKRVVELRPVANTSIIDVKVYDRNPGEAAAIANALAGAFQEFRREEWQSKAGAAPTVPLVEVLDAAMPGVRPARPNKPLTIFLGLFGGGFLALAVGGIGALIVRRHRRFAIPPVIPA